MLIIVVILLLILLNLGFLIFRFANKTLNNIMDAIPFFNIVSNYLDNDNSNNNTSSSINKYTGDVLYDNYKFNFIITISVAGNNISSESNGIVDEKNQKEFLETNIDVSGLSVLSKIYEDYNNNISYTSFY